MQCTVPHSLRPPRYVALLCLILQTCLACTTYQAPTGYRCFPEYGCLPIIEHGSWLTRFPSYTGVYPAYVSSRGSDTPLPATIDEARERAQETRSFYARRARMQLLGELALAPISIPVILIVFAPGLAMLTGWAAQSSMEERAERASAEQEQAERELIEKYERRIQIRAVDTAGNPVEGATILPLVSPIRFPSFAENDGHRSFPQRASYDFTIEPDLAADLASRLPEEGEIPTRPGLVELSGRTDAEGRWEHHNLLLAIDPEQRAEPFETVYLIAHKGSPGTVLRLPLSERTPRELTLEAVLSIGTRSLETTGPNPWEVLRQLESAVGYFVTRKYSRYYRAEPAGPPPLSNADLEQIVEQAETLAPGFPLSDVVRFFLAIERGDGEAAKSHARFVSDYHYMRLIYDLAWSEGIPLR